MDAKKRSDRLRILVAGAGGRLGASMAADLARAGHDVSATKSTELNICDAQQVNDHVSLFRPDVIVNCTGYNAVDAAESNQAAAQAVNGSGPALLAAVASSRGSILVHFSTDFVFDGQASEPYTEDAATNPLSVYGATKLEGERAVGQIAEHYILRVESLFGGVPVNGQRATIDWLIDRLSDGASVPVVVDRTVTPSYVADVATATRAIIEGSAPFGTYHCVNSGCTTWYGLALEIARQLGVEERITPVRAADLRTVATRPQFCALSNEKLRKTGCAMPTWQSAVSRHLKWRFAFQPSGSRAQHFDLRSRFGEGLRSLQQL
jgi:dTDP-4-dehydrorhamnose reductase